MKLLAGQNIYRVVYTYPHVETEFEKLVVAKDQDEAIEIIGRAVTKYAQVVERDISMVIPDEYINDEAGSENKFDIVPLFVGIGVGQCIVWAIQIIMWLF